MYCFKTLSCQKENCPVRRSKARRCWEYFLKVLHREPSVNECPFAPCSQCHYRLGWEIGLITDEVFPAEETTDADELLPPAPEGPVSPVPPVPPAPKAKLTPSPDPLTPDEIIEVPLPQAAPVPIPEGLGQKGKRFCWEVVSCPNPHCPVKERGIIRCFKFFEPRGMEEKLKVTCGTRTCDQCHYKRGWDLEIIGEHLFDDYLAERRQKMVKTERLQRETIVEIYLQELAKKPLSRDEEVALAKRLAGDQKASELLFLANLKLVVRIANSYSSRGLNVMDLIQEGNIGLIKAISKFDYTLGYRFSTYAAYWIRHYMQKAVSDQSRVVRIPHHLLVVAHKIRRAIHDMQGELQRAPTLTELSKVMLLEEDKILDIIRMTETPVSIEAQNPGSDDEDSSLEYYLADKKNLTPEEEALEKSKVEACRKALELLPERLREIVELFYGFRDESLSLAEIGRRMNISRERARQLLKQALDDLQGREFVINLQDFV